MKTYKKIENTIRTLLTILFILSFVFWFFYSLIAPIKNITLESDNFDYVLAFSSLVVIITFMVKVIPQVIKRKNLDSLNLKVGNTKDKPKKKECGSCKKKK